MPTEKNSTNRKARGSRVLRVVGDIPNSEDSPRGEVIDRLRLAAAGIPWSEIARRTEVPVETARRQITHGRPTLAFVGVFCERFDVSPDWLLTGRGPRAYSEVGGHWVRTAEPTELLAHVGRQLQSIKDATAILCETKREAPGRPGCINGRAGRIGGRGAVPGVRGPSTNAADRAGVESSEGSWPRLHRLPFPDGCLPVNNIRPRAGPREGRA